MEQRVLGNTGLQVAALAFGAAPLGDLFGQIDETAAIEAVHAAIDHGVNYFDTAPLYGFGLAEERLGRALAGRRDDVVLAIGQDNAFPWIERDLGIELPMLSRNVELWEEMVDERGMGDVDHSGIFRMYEDRQAG